VRAGANCPDTVQAHHGCQFNCGKCKPAMAEVVACEQQRQTSELPLVAAE
jgi:bacterioferritin-associated ferredoxin